MLDGDNCAFLCFLGAIGTYQDAVGIPPFSVSAQITALLEHSQIRKQALSLMQMLVIAGCRVRLRVVRILENAKGNVEIALAIVFHTLHNLQVSASEHYPWKSLALTFLIHVYFPYIVVQNACPKHGHRTFSLFGCHLLQGKCILTLTPKLQNPKALNEWFLSLEGPFEQPLQDLGIKAREAQVERR